MGRLVAVLADAELCRHSHREFAWPCLGASQPPELVRRRICARATALDVPLVTADHKLASAPGLPCTVELV
jgi:hypothetical protein